jgi:hypothetical protein
MRYSGKDPQMLDGDVFRAIPTRRNPNSRLSQQAISEVERVEKEKRALEERIGRGRMS